MLFFFTLDTERLLQKTYDTPAKTEKHFEIKIHNFSGIRKLLKKW